MKDPVCGMTVMEESAIATIEWEGVRYGFCSQHCYDSFSKQPEKYAQKDEGHKIHHNHNGHSHSHGNKC